MTWLHRWIVDLFNALAAWYYRRKYGAAARQLGRYAEDEGQGRRGFVIVEIDGDEVPIMDGSAGPFVFLMQSAGIAEQATAMVEGSLAAFQERDPAKARAVADLDDQIDASERDTIEEVLRELEAQSGG